MVKMDVSTSATKRCTCFACKTGEFRAKMTQQKKVETFMNLLNPCKMRSAFLSMMMAASLLICAEEIKDEEENSSSSKKSKWCATTK